MAGTRHPCSGPRQRSPAQGHCTRAPSQRSPCSTGASPSPPGRPTVPSAFELGATDLPSGLPRIRRRTPISGRQPPRPHPAVARVGHDRTCLPTFPQEAVIAVAMRIDVYTATAMKCPAALVVAWPLRPSCSSGCHSPRARCPGSLIAAGQRSPFGMQLGQRMWRSWPPSKRRGAPMAGFHPLAQDSSTPAARLARRGLLRTLPVILLAATRCACTPPTLPLGLELRAFLGGPARTASPSQWRCSATRAGHRPLSGHDCCRLAASAPSSVPQRQRWLETLRLSDPEVFTSPSARYRSGDLVRLVIECQRPDGSPVGDTVRLDFRLGEQDQVVTALEPGLSQAGPGAHWTVWALSSNAFGSQPQPKLGLPAHTPLKFSVVAE